MKDCNHQYVTNYAGGEWSCEECGAEFVPADQAEKDFRYGLRIGITIGAVVTFCAWLLAMGVM